ncbi:hypothetical protein RHD99_13360 [Buttiauxella selenatireducens]|uniref:Uncharacterized protein n=1 Tax=Buttiauxella selenatireducens TaxID=3073902 RepID=A0ABY9S563_9ENTR|nr:hypothetical protein [Buttiauxella sp. R73]WMY72474.1 hypothetical protein RHD99_13360 [Buttiauxella sp. R73]
MYTSDNSNQQLSFIGQNSHGSDESWPFRMNVLKKIPLTEPTAVVFECPTVDLILYSLKRKSFNKNISHQHLSFSTYWWMRSQECISFLEIIPREFDVFGIDVPLSLKEHSNYISKIKKMMSFPALVKLLDKDKSLNHTMDLITPELRENLLFEKLSLITNENYKNVLVICHNFHATKNSWLSYSSLCQRFVENSNYSGDITALAIFSDDMNFLATPDGKKLIRIVFPRLAKDVMIKHLM